MTVPQLITLLDDGTGTFPFNISRFVMFDDGFTFSRGRADWQGVVTGSQQSLKLNNSTGWCTAGSTMLASPSPIVVDQRIRILEKVNGTTFTRGTWYVKSWPVAWPATVVTIAMSTISTVDAQARAERRTLQSVIEEEILIDSPIWYYPLSEPVGATNAADNAGTQSAAATQVGSGVAVTFGNAGPITSAQTVAMFAGAKYLQAAGGLFFDVSVAPISIVVAFSTTGSGTIMNLFGSIPSGGSLLFVDATGHLATTLGGGLASTATVNDGTWHVASLSLNSAGPGGVGLVLDGVLAASGVDTGTSAARDIGKGFIGSIANVAVVPTLSLTRMATYASAVLNGLAGESGTARITRTAGYANVPVGALDASLTNVAFADIAGTSAWDAMQAATDAEGGLLFIDGSGNLQFHNRARVAGKTSPDLVLAASALTPDVEPVVDDQQIVNYFEATSATGTMQVARDLVSELGDGTPANPGHGRYADSKSYLVTTDQEALDRANWIVSKFAEPTVRYGTMTINLFKMTEVQAAAVLAVLDLDIWLRITSMAGQNPGGTVADVVVEGFTETAAAETWTITCNVVSMSLFRALILDDPVFGALDSYPIFY